MKPKRSSRVTPRRFSSGHAIGHAAALCVAADISVRGIAASDFRALMNKDGARLGD